MGKRFRLVDIGRMGCGKEYVVVGRKGEAVGFVVVTICGNFERVLIFWIAKAWMKYIRVSFYDGSFYDDSLFRPLCSRTSTVDLWCISVAIQASFLYLSTFLALFRWACVSAFSVLVQFFEVYFDFSTHDVHQKDRKEDTIKTVDVTFCLDVFWTTAWAFFSKIKSDLK